MKSTCDLHPHLTRSANRPAVLELRVVQLHLDELVDERTLQDVLLEMRLRNDDPRVLLFDCLVQLARLERTTLRQHVHDCAAWARHAARLGRRHDKLPAGGRLREGLLEPGSSRAATVTRREDGGGGATGCRGGSC